MNLFYLLWSHEFCKADVATNFGDEPFLLSVGIVYINYTKMAAILVMSSTNKTWLHHNDGILGFVYRNYEIFTFWLATNLAV
jgi:hypothetical protein